MTERGAVWLAYLTGGQGVGGSNPLAPTRWGRCKNSVPIFIYKVNFLNRHFWVELIKFQDLNSK